MGSDPRALAYDGTFIYVMCSGGNKVVRIRASTGTNTGFISGSGFPVAIAFDGTFMYVTNAVGANCPMTKIRASTGSVEGDPVLVGDSPGALVFDGIFMYVANGTNDTVRRL